jgi:hypothetical protein
MRGGAMRGYKPPKKKVGSPGRGVVIQKKQRLREKVGQFSPIELQGFI